MFPLFMFEPWKSMFFGKENNINDDDNCYYDEKDYDYDYDYDDENNENDDRFAVGMIIIFIVLIIAFIALCFF